MSQKEEKNNSRTILIIFVIVSVMILSVWIYVHPLKCYFISEWAIDDIQLRLAYLEGLLEGTAIIEDDEDLSNTKNWLFWSCMIAFPDEIDKINMDIYPDEPMVVDEEI